MTVFASKTLFPRKAVLYKGNRMPTYSTFSPAKSKTLVIFILLGSDDSSSSFSSFFSVASVSSDFLSGIESKMELTMLRGCVDLPEDDEDLEAWGSIQ